MAGFIPSQKPNTGSFVQQTPAFDVARLSETDVNSEEFKDLIVQLAQQTNNMSIVLNTKQSGLYLTNEFLNGNLYPPKTLTGNNQLRQRNEYQILVIFPQLTAGVNTMVHGIPVDANTVFTGFKGMANDPTGFNYYPLPWASAAGLTNIEVKANATNIIITNNSGIVFATTPVVLFYLKY